MGSCAQSVSNASSRNRHVEAMTPRATLLGVLVVFAAFTIAAADTSCLERYNKTISNLMEETGGPKIRLADMIDSDKLVVMDLRAYINQRARNPMQKRRILIIVYIRCPDD